jgi:uncharacterized membrane protein SpoIIM required for sporulation
MRLELRSQRFRAEREADWRALEALLAKAERGRVRQLSDDDLLRLPVLYHGALSSLSVARATSLDAALVAYLEALAARAYFFVYGTRLRLWERARSFFADDWPTAARGLWRESLASALLLVAGAVVGAILVTQDADWFGSIIPGALSHGRDPTASTTYLRKVLYDDNGGQDLSAFAVFLFTHNAQVCLLAFALGFVFCLPTALLMADNGLTLGALIAVYASRGLGLQLGGWLAIHGATELLATVLAGAAGFHIGLAVIFPGERSRLDAAAQAGRAAGTVMGGVVVMLVFAGLLEGLARQLIKDDAVRWAIGAGTLAIWLAYFYLPRRRRA